MFAFFLYERCVSKFSTDNGVRSGERAGPLNMWSQKVLCNANCDLQFVWATAQSCWKTPYSFSSSCKFTKKVRKSVYCSLSEVAVLFS